VEQVLEHHAPQPGVAQRAQPLDDLVDRPDDPRLGRGVSRSRSR